MSKYSSNFIYKDSSTNHNICIYRHEFDRNIKFVNDRKRRALAAELAMHGQGQWSDRDVELLLEELEIEVGEGTNRFLYEDERISYCLYLSQVIQFDDNKSADTIYEQIIWLWSTWEAISRATGKSWWNISERDKYLLSLSENDQDQQLKSQFKFFDLCDRVFSYITVEEGEDDNVNTEDSIYY